MEANAGHACEYGTFAARRSIGGGVAPYDSGNTNPIPTGNCWDGEDIVVTPVRPIVLTAEVSCLSGANVRSLGCNDSSTDGSKPLGNVTRSYNDRAS